MSLKVEDDKMADYPTMLLPAYNKHYFLVRQGMDTTMVRLIEYNIQKNALLSSL